MALSYDAAKDVNKYEGILFLAPESHMKVLRDLRFNGPELVITHSDVLDAIHASIMSTSAQTIPSLVSQAVRVPVANFTYYDLYVCFDPVNANDDNARYHLVRPIRFNVGLELGGYKLTPTLSNFDVSRQFTQSRTA